MSFHHGVKVIEITEGPISMRTVSTAIIGLIATADDADADFFPLDTPKLITNVVTAIGKAGKTGTLAASLNAIAAQCSPFIVVVRVASDADENEQTAKVCGTVTENGKKTGIKALLTAETATGLKPRILIAPGLDNLTVANELITTAQKLRAFCYLAARGCKNIEEAANYRANFGAREAMIIYPDFTGFNQATKQTEKLEATAYAAGLRAKIDNDIGWHKTLSNLPVNGVEGVSRDVSWSLQDPTTDANYLNSKEVTTLIRKDGFRFWGNRTCDSSGFFHFENYTRTAQILADTIAEGSFTFVDKPLTPSLINSIVETCNNKFRELQNNNYIGWAKAKYKPEKNPDDLLNAGQLIISFDFKPVGVLETLIYEQHISLKMTSEN